MLDFDSTVAVNCGLFGSSILQPVKVLELGGGLLGPPPSSHSTSTMHSPAGAPPPRSAQVKVPFSGDSCGVGS